MAFTGILVDGPKLSHFVNEIGAEILGGFVEIRVRKILVDFG